MASDNDWPATKRGIDMTKNESREVKMAQQALAMGERSMAARILANLYRAGSKNTQEEVMLLAQAWGICGQSSFIVGG